MGRLSETADRGRLLDPRTDEDEDSTTPSLFECLSHRVSEERIDANGLGENLWLLLVEMTAVKLLDRPRHHGPATRPLPGKDSQASARELAWARCEPSLAFLTLMDGLYRELMSDVNDDQLRELVRLAMQGFTLAEIANQTHCCPRWAAEQLKIIQTSWEHRSVSVPAMRLALE